MPQKGAKKEEEKLEDRKQEVAMAVVAITTANICPTPCPSQLFVM